MEFQFLGCGSDEKTQQRLAKDRAAKFVLMRTAQSHRCIVFMLLWEHFGVYDGQKAQHPVDEFDGAGEVTSHDDPLEPVRLEWRSGPLQSHFHRVAPENDAVRNQCAGEICERMRHLFALQRT